MVALVAYGRYTCLEKVAQTLCPCPLAYSTYCASLTHPPAACACTLVPVTFGWCLGTPALTSTATSRHVRSPPPLFVQGDRSPRTYSVRGFRTILDVSGRSPKCFVAREGFWSSSLVKKTFSATSSGLAGSKFRAIKRGYFVDCLLATLRFPGSWSTAPLVRSALCCRARAFFLPALLCQ